MIVWGQSRSTEDWTSGFPENIGTFLKKCSKPVAYPEVIRKYFDYTCQLEFKAKPDYKKIRRFLGAARFAWQ